MPKKKLITFGPHLSPVVRDIAKSHRSFVQQVQIPAPRVNSAYVAMAKTPGSGIAARSGSTFSSAECTFAYLNADDELTDYSAQGVEAVFNPYYFPIPGDFYIDVYREVFSGRLLAILKGGFIIYLGYGDTITARSGTTLGTGDVGLFGQSGTTLVDLNTTATVYNNTLQTPAGSDVYLQAKINAQGYLLWDVDDCAA